MATFVLPLYFAGVATVLFVTSLWISSVVKDFDNSTHGALRSEVARGKNKNSGPIGLPYLKMLHLPPWYDHDNWANTTIDNNANFPAIFNERKPDLGHLNGDSEDLTILQEYFNGVRDGLILEVGAMDGDYLSVSKVMERLFGWRSILIEANVDTASQLAKNRPQAVSFNAAICAEPSTVHFSAGGDIGVVVEFADQQFLNSFHGHLMTDGKLDSEKLKQVPEILCVPVGPTLKGLGVKHLSVWVLDCEGCELEALRSVDFNELRVDVLVVETNRFGKEEYTQQTIDLMAKYPQYEVSHRVLGRNTWFKHRDFQPRAAPAPGN